MLELLSYQFMRNALAAGMLVGIACGIVGALVVVNRMSFLAGGVAHAAYGGLGLAALTGVRPMTGAVGFTVVASLLMGIVSRKMRERADTIIGVMWALGMAIGVVLIDLAPGYQVDLMSYLFGSILTVSLRDLVFMGALDIVIVTAVALLYKEIQGMSYDEEFANISGVPVTWLYFVELLMVALTVVMLIRAVGLILVIALFTIPASLAEMFTRNLRALMTISIGLSVLFTTAGLVVSYFLDLTAGATIILVAGASYVVAHLVASILRKTGIVRNT